MTSLTSEVGWMEVKSPHRVRGWHVVYRVWGRDGVVVAAIVFEGVITWGKC